MTSSAPRIVTLLVAALFVATGVAGCFGDVTAVYVPRSDIASDWSHAQENETTEIGGGAVEVVLNEYRYSQTNSARILAVAATDVPFVSEKSRLEEQIFSFAEEHDVSLQKTGSTTKTLDNGQRVDVDTYDMTKKEAWGQANGKAWVMTWDTGDFFAGAIGFATTEYQASGLLGGQKQTDDAQWREAQEMMRALDW